jgi:MFS family permease
VTAIDAEPEVQPGTEPGTAGSASLLRQPDFVKLWTAETVSQFGTQVSQLAIPFVAITLLNATTFEIGLLNVVDFLPFLLIGLVAGVWVDRLHRRPILIAADLGRAVLLATIPLAYALDVLTILQLYVVGFAVGCLTVFFDVAYQSYLPSLVGREHLVEGNGKLEISRSAAAILGPGFGGLLIGILQAPFAIIADAISYVGSALFVLLIRRHEPPPDHHEGTVAGPRTGMRREMAEGLRYVVTHRYLRSIAACTGWGNLFGNIGFAVLMVFAYRELQMPVEAVGAAFSIGSLGALAGAFGSSRIAARIGVGPTIVLFASIGAPTLLLFPLVPVGAPLWLMMAVLALNGFVGGIGMVVYNVNQVSLRQAITPTRLQGRMNASMRWFVWGTIPIGALIGGALGTLIGLRETLIIAAVGESLAFLFVLLSPVRSIREMPAPVSDE